MSISSPSARYCTFTATTIDESPSGFLLIDREVDLCIPVPVESLAILDFGSDEHGSFALHKGEVPDFSYMGPRSQPKPQPPTHAHDLRPGIRIQILFERYGLWWWASNAETTLDRVDTLRRKFERQPFAHQGLLGFVQIGLASGFALRSQGGKMIYTPTLRLTGDSSPRPEEIFGPRSVPPPDPASSDPYHLLMAPRETGSRPLVADELFASASKYPLAVPRPTRPSPRPRIEDDEVRF